MMLVQIVQKIQSGVDVINSAYFIVMRIFLSFCKSIKK